MKHNAFRALARWLAGLGLTLALVACSSTGQVVDHSFGFDIRKAVPPVQVLDYHYGSSGMTGTRPAKWAVEEGTPFYFQGITGPISLADSLYVKWRLKETGEVFEETVDLRHRLPRDMKDKKVYFDIKGAQLFIYVISPEYLPKGAPRSPIRTYYNHPYTTIYPTLTQH